MGTPPLVFQSVSWIIGAVKHVSIRDDLPRLETGLRGPRNTGWTTLQINIDGQNNCAGMNWPCQGLSDRQQRAYHKASA